MWIIVLFIIVIIVMVRLYFNEKRFIKRDPQKFFKIGPLSYPIKNYSTLIYRDLGKMGRTGNQLFEIAATISIGYENGCRVVFPSTIKNLPVYQLFDLSYLTLEDPLINDTIREYDNYDRIIVPNDGQTYNLTGYRQSYLYFLPIKDYLKELFPLKDSPIKGDYTAIHVRRTDTVRDSKIAPSINCSLDYYRKALEGNRDPVVVVTDDPFWALEHFPDCLIQSKSMVEDFSWLYHAKTLVIANSTFSLWAAFLGNAKKIIAPLYWFSSEGFPAIVSKVRYQQICYPWWKFLDPITGEEGKPPKEIEEKSPINRWLRAIFSDSTWR
jgi:hypothetical protein